jgi:DNA-binding response OmpR family regulator/HPt (histidine-containing phosphotransfer) domain-containing protein
MDNRRNRVLIVDHEKMSIGILSGILHPDYAVFIAMNGCTALEITDKFLPDIILLDILMPDMNGFDVLAVLNASAATRHIPVIVITGLDSAADEEKGLDMGAADFIHKPLSAKVVRSRVRNQMQRIPEIHIHNETPPHPKEIKEASDKVFNSGDLPLGFAEGIQKINEIDTEIGFNHFCGAQEIYYTTVNMFSKNILRECHTMTAFLDARDIEGFAIFVNGMKSSLAAIGAMKLSKMAMEMEIASKNREIDFCLERFLKFKEKLLLLRERLSVILPEGEPAAEAKGIASLMRGSPPEQLRETVQKALTAA